jgi:hypothetical protein
VHIPRAQSEDGDAWVEKNATQGRRPDMS